MKNVANQMKEMMDIIKSTQTSQIQGESHLNDLQELLISPVLIR